MATRKSYYIIRGGVQGRERLRILSGVMRPSAISLLERVGVKPAMRCLDIGCGGGDLVFDLARMVGNEGVVVGTDLDLEKLGIARAEEVCQFFCVNGRGLFLGLGMGARGKGQRLFPRPAM